MEHMGRCKCPGVKDAEMRSSTLLSFLAIRRKGAVAMEKLVKASILSAVLAKG